MRHFKVTIKGKVQGVFYRQSTRDKARQLGIKGFIKNMPDGSVYMEAEGEDDALQNLIDWCHFGSPKAKVIAVELEPGVLKSFSHFEIKY